MSPASPGGPAPAADRVASPAPPRPRPRTWPAFPGGPGLPGVLGVAAALVAALLLAPGAAAHGASPGHPLTFAGIEGPGLALGQPGALAGEVRAPWYAVKDLAVTAKPGPGLAVAPGFVKMGALPAGHAAGFSFQVTVLQPGVHHLRLEATADIPRWNPTVHALDLYLATHPDGTVEVHLEEPPDPLEGLGALAPADPGVFQGPISAAWASRAPPGPPAGRGGGSGSGAGSQQVIGAQGGMMALKVCISYPGPDDKPRPLPWAFTDVFESDGIGTQLLGDGFTGPDGCLHLLAPDHDEGDADAALEIRVRVTADNAAVHLDLDTPEWEGEAVVPAGQSSAAVYFAPSTKGWWLRYYHYLNMGWTFASADMDLPTWLGGITGRVEDCDDDEASHYHRNQHALDLCLGSGDSKRPDLVLHEYGHHAMWTVYDPDWPSPGGAHEFCDTGGPQPDLDADEVRGLAWAEGFANWFGVAASRALVDGDTKYDGGWDVEAATGCPGTGNTGDDEETLVAQALWDIVDAANEHPLDVAAAGPQALGTFLQAEVHEDFHDFYESWGAAKSAVRRAAFLNSIDYNVGPAPPDLVVPAVPGPGAPATITAIAQPGTAQAFIGGQVQTFTGDWDGDPIAVEFVLAASVGCGKPLVAVTVEGAGVWVADLPTKGIHDKSYPWVYVCARATDGMEPSGWVVAKDGAGKPVKFKVDNTPPELQVAFQGTAGLGGWYVSPVTMTAQCQDLQDPAPVVTYAVTTLQPGPKKAFPPGGVVFAVPGTHLGAVHCVDASWNAAKKDYKVRVDASPPTTAIGTAGTGFLCAPPGCVSPSGWHLHHPAFQVTCKDLGSGCAKVQYHLKVNGLDTTGGFTGQPYWKDYAGPVKLPFDGHVAVTARSIDVAGNVGPVASKVFLVDTKPPTAPALSLPAVLAPPSYPHEVKVSPGASTDGAGSGVSHYVLVVRQDGKTTLKTQLPHPPPAGVPAATLLPGKFAVSKVEVAVQAVDHVGRASAWTTKAAAVNQPPTADAGSDGEAVLDPVPGPQGNAASVEVWAGASDPDGDADLQKCWDFGDGKAPTCTKLLKWSHVYDDTSNPKPVACQTVYTVTLVVKDSHGTPSLPDTKKVQVVSPTGC